VVDAPLLPDVQRAGNWLRSHTHDAPHAVTSSSNGEAMPLRSAITSITPKPGGVGWKALRQPLPR